MTYSKSILELKRKSIAMGLCGDYKEKWNNSTTPENLVDMAADINGADFLCASVAKDWGLSKEFLLKNFKGLINGDYVAKCGKDNGYTSEIYIGHCGEITARTTLLVFLYSDVVVHIPVNHVCRIFAAKNINVRVECNGICEFVEYTPNDCTNYNTNGNFGRITISDPHKDPNSWINFSSKNEKI